MLWENANPGDNFPIFVDDIFMRSDLQQFSLDKLMQTLPDRQVVALVHENSLAQQSPSNYCDKFYTMRRTRNWTNVEIHQDI